MHLRLKIHNMLFTIHNKEVISKLTDFERQIPAIVLTKPLHLYLLTDNHSLVDFSRNCTLCKL